MKNYYPLPGFFLGIVKPPGLLFFWTLALWLTNLTEAQSNTRGVGNKPVQVGQTISSKDEGMRGIPILNTEPGYFLRSRKAYPPGVHYATR